MRRAIAVLLPLLALSLLAVACGDEGGQPETMASPAATGTPQVTATETAQVTPTETPQITPAETPQITATETPQAETTPTPSDGQVRQAVVAADQSEFLTQDVVLETCDYDQDSGLVDCQANGLYQLQDGIQGTGAVCRVMLVDDQPVGLSCQTSDPLRVIGYAIQPSPAPAPAP